MSGITINEDSTHFYHTRSADQMTEECVDAFIDTYAGTDVREMMFNVNARYTSYPSEVWQNYWHGYDPDGNHDESFKDHFQGNVPPTKVHGIHNLYLLAERGIDPFARWMKRCREENISPWISLRMNDLHHMQMSIGDRRRLLSEADPPHHRVPYRTTMTLQDGAPDYAQPAVYDHFMALVNEVAERYDLDGLEFDFTRHFWFFRPGRTIEDQPVMNRFVRETREILKAQEQHLGHEVRLCAKVPSCERTSRWLGMDAVLWAREGLVDYVVPSPRWYSVDFDMRIDEWKRLLEGTGVMLGAAMEPRVNPYPRSGKPAQGSLMVNAELVRGAAANYLNQGADRIYLMNFFDDRNDLLGRNLITGENLLNDAGSMATIEGKPRRHMITFLDVVAPGQVMSHQLPLIPVIDYEGDPYFGELRLDTGPRPETGTATVILAFSKEQPDPPEDFELFVNGIKAIHTGRIEIDPPVPQTPLHGFDLPIDALNSGQNVLELMSESPWEVHWAEIRLEG
jgi:hypothetical protein